MSGECEKCGLHALECECLCENRTLKAECLCGNHTIDQGWISINDKIPEIWEPILTTDGDSIEIMRYVGEYKGSHDWSSYSCTTLDVTHWMPLPELPKNEGI